VNPPTGNWIKPQNVTGMIISSASGFVCGATIALLLGANLTGAVGVGLQLAAVIWAMLYPQIKGEPWASSILPWMISIAFLYHGLAFFLANLDPTHAWRLSSSVYYRNLALFQSGIALWIITIGFILSRRFGRHLSQPLREIRPLIAHRLRIVFYICGAAALVYAMYLSKHSIFFSRGIVKANYTESIAVQLLWAFIMAVMFLGVYLVFKDQSKRRLTPLGILLLLSIMVVYFLSGARMALILIIISSYIVISELINKSLTFGKILILVLIFGVIIFGVNVIRAVALEEVAHQANQINILWKTLSSPNTFSGDVLNMAAARTLHDLSYRFNAIDPQAAVLQNGEILGGRSTLRDFFYAIPRFLWPGKIQAIRNQGGIATMLGVNIDLQITWINQQLADWGWLMGIGALFLTGLGLGFWERLLTVTTPNFWKLMLYAVSLPPILSLDGGLLQYKLVGVRNALFITMIIWAVWIIIGIFTRKNARVGMRG